MKKLFFYLFAIMAMVACSDDSSTEGGGNNGGNNGGGQTTQASLTVSPTNVDFSTDGGTSKVTITSSAAWTAELVNDRADDWCSIDSTSGSAGTSTLTITATANDTPDDRTATIVVKSGTLSKTINVSQKQKDALTVTSSKFEVDAEGGEVVVEVKANIDFEYAIDDAAKDWISYEGTRAIQTSTLVFKVAKNDDTEKREGTITIKSGEFSEDVMIYQAGEEPSIVISQDEYTVSSDGETIAVEVSSNVDVAVEIPEDVDWIKESTTRATSTNTYYFDITKNEDYDQRSAEICFTNKENNLSEGVTITQVQKDALVVAKDSYTIDSEGDEIVIEVGHNIDFDVKISADWITRKETRAFNTDKLTFVIAENKDYDNREGTIVFKSKNDALSQIVKVYQAQKDALIISKKDIVVSAESGTISFELQTNVEFKVSEPNVDWLRAVTTRSLTTHTLHYEYDANTSYDSRKAQIIITDTKNNKSETITITQAQKDAIVLAKSEYEFAGDGGNLDFEIQTNVDITVTISDNAKDWIQQVETRALETKSLYFNIATYEAETDREGSITISGGNATQSIIVKQTGMKVEIIAFEDDLFKAYLVDNFDTNNDDEIDTREALSITTINCSGRSIYSLKGIEYLVNLKKLNCSNNSIVELDLTQNVNLTEIKCYSNSIVNLKLNGLTDLVYLDCNTNSLTSIDTSTNSALTYYSCASNPIKALDVSTNTKLETLRCNSCSLLTSLNISNCGSLTALYINSYDSVSGSAITIDNSSLQSITLGGTAKWVTATITNNPYLKSIDFSNLRTLTSLTCTNNIQLSSLVTDKCYALKYIDCSTNALTALDLSTNQALFTLSCNGNNLNTLDLTKNIALNVLDCNNNQITTLNVNNCKSLTDLYVQNNKLTALTINNLTELAMLKCSNNSLSLLDVSGNNKLLYLDCCNNILSSIDISMLANLDNFYCCGNTKLFPTTTLKGVLKIGYGIHIQGGDGIIYSVEENNTSGKVVSLLEKEGIRHTEAVSWATVMGDNWSIPSLDEWKLIYEYRDIIQNSLLAVGAERIHGTIDTLLWTNKSSTYFRWSTGTSYSPGGPNTGNTRLTGSYKY